MGYSYRNNGNITDYWPDDDSNNLYIPSHDALSISEILEKIKEHFGETSNFEEFTIQAEHIHTSCLTYDSYDSGDYTMFLHIEKN